MLFGLALGSLQGVWVLCRNNRSWEESHDLEPTPFYQSCREVYPYGERRGICFMIDWHCALTFALGEEVADAPRPPAMPLREREEKAVLLAQMGLRVREVHLRILRFAGLVGMERRSQLQASSQVPAGGRALPFRSVADT